MSKMLDQNVEELLYLLDELLVENHCHLLGLFICKHHTDSDDKHETTRAYVRAFNHEKLGIYTRIRDFCDRVLKGENLDEPPIVH